MPDYALLKTLHLGCAVLSISGFAARLALMISGSAVLRARLVRVLPHVVDTVLLASALAMVWLLGVNPLAEAWLAAKIVALVVAGFIVSVAVTKSAWGFLAP